MERSDLLRASSRRRVNLFLSAVIFVAFLGVTMVEIADLSDIIDGGGLVVSAVLDLAVIGLRWRKNSPVPLRSTNNVIMALVLVMIALTFLGIYNEIGDQAAFGDDVAQLTVTVAFLRNRFVP